MDKIKSLVLALFHLVLPNPDWKKLAWAAGCGVASFFLLGYIVPAVLSVKVVSIAGACVVAYLIYTKVAMWEIEKLVAAAKAEATAAVDAVKKL